MAMSEEDRKALAKDIVEELGKQDNGLAKTIVAELFEEVDLSLGKSVRKKLVYVVVIGIIVAGVSFGIIHIPTAPLGN